MLKMQLLETIEGNMFMNTPNQKLYTCQRCRERKPPDQFYERHDKPKPRPASYCKACNHEAVIEAKYRKEARRRS
jgi:hypothetical protein